ncbi:MAG: hypothetical protein IKE24_07060 [Clostridia bacterium]|nr:hypothetical protein [Clostridia bacterium]
MKRILAMLLMLAMLPCWGLPARAEESDDIQTVLDLAAEREESLGDLRVIELNIREEGEETDPEAMDTPEKTWLAALANALEARWDAEGEEAPNHMDPAVRDRYETMARAEMEILDAYREIPLEDPLLDLLRGAYMDALQKQLEVCEGYNAEEAAIPAEGEDQEKILADRLTSLILGSLYEEPEQEEIRTVSASQISFSHRWRKARQESLKSLYFINRYYGVFVDEAYRAKIHSYMYEGALLITEDTVEELAEARAEAAEEPAKEAEAEDPAAAETYGPDIWHGDASGEYELRIYDLNTEELTLTLDLREKAGGETTTSKISLSQWERYTQKRYTLGTFYQVEQASAAGGKLSFMLHLNAMVDGRLYRDVKGKITVRLPGAAGQAEGTGSPAGTEGSGGASEPAQTVREQEFEEDPFEQDFTGLKPGDVIRMGYYEQDGNTDNLREPLEWKVISVNKKKNVALVTTVYAIESMPYGTAGDEEEYTRVGFNWKTCGLREWLEKEFYSSSFTEAEKKRIRTATNVTKDPSGRFTTKDKVFLLSQIEARRYFGTAKKLKCEATPYVLAKLGSDSPAIAPDGYANWWVRELTRAALALRNGDHKPKTYNEAGYVFGGRGMAQFMRKRGAKTNEENIALVRPAMWIKFDAADKD